MRTRSDRNRLAGCEPRLPLGVWADLVRVLKRQPAQVRDLPVLSGVAKEATARWLKGLQQRGLAEVVPDAGGSRFKLARLTPRGRTEAKACGRQTAEVEEDWEARFGVEAISELRTCLQTLIAEPTLEYSPLRLAVTPYPEGWRAELPAPLTLPHYPVVSHRGGFPDGS